MGSCYSGDHIAGYHTHTEITTYDIEEPRQTYRLETVRNRLIGGGGGGGLKLVNWIQSKKENNDQELIQSNPTSHP